MKGTHRENSVTLDVAIEEILRDHGNRPMTSRKIAEEIAARGTFIRPSDGRFPPPSQISARISNATYRERFERTPTGIRLRHVR